RAVRAQLDDCLHAQAVSIGPFASRGAALFRPAKIGWLSSTNTFALASPPSPDCGTKSVQRRVALAWLGYHLYDPPLDRRTSGGRKFSRKSLAKPSATQNVLFGLFSARRKFTRVQR